MKGLTSGQHSNHKTTSNPSWSLAPCWLHFDEKA